MPLRLRDLPFVRQGEGHTNLQRWKALSVEPVMHPAKKCCLRARFACLLGKMFVPGD